MSNKKTPKLGQHWLHDSKILGEIADLVMIEDSEPVLEVGPGLGTLTSRLLKRGAEVLAVEYDDKLAGNLPKSFPGKDNLKVLNADILDFNFEELKADYKIAANLPYYISGAFFRILTQITNKPKKAVLLIQKEVAERVGSSPEYGNSNKLSMIVNYHYRTKLELIVEPRSFNPPPKVRSQVLVLDRRVEPLFKNVDFKTYTRLVKIAFSSPRKTLINNLASGLHIEKADVHSKLELLELKDDVRAEELSLDHWAGLFTIFSKQSL